VSKQREGAAIGWGLMVRSVKAIPDQILVLVVEDEEMVRLTIVEALRDEGFEAIEVDHAAAALVTLLAHARRIHVLFTDIQMPGTMDGVALAHHTSEHWPWIGLIVTSARPRPHRMTPPQRCRFLPKPYQHRHVVRHIRELYAAEGRRIRSDRARQAEH
jgi:CheY-like chemotaxis protein